jgi:DNA-binding transcriptional ArsR family regulator
MAGGGAEAFSLLGNETRLRVIQSLGDLSAPGEFSTISFSRLYEASDVADSGTFNYHLQKLTDQFVLSTEEGYRLSLQGINVYRGLRAGIFETGQQGVVGDVAGVRVATDLPCLACDSPLEVWVADGRLHLGCEPCGHVDMRYPVPAGGLERAAEAIRSEDGTTAHAVLRERVVADYISMLMGFCPYCSGETSVMLTTDTSELPEPSDVRLGFVVRLTCEYCHWYMHGNLGMCLRNHPVVVPFLQQRGLEPFRQEVGRVCDIEVDVASESPWRLAASVAVDGERLVVELDESLRALDSWVEGAAVDGTGTGVET